MKITAKHQPAPPANDADGPFTPVEFEGLSGLPYVEDNGNFSTITWSMKATGIKAVGKSAPRATTDQAKGAV